MNVGADIIRPKKRRFECAEKLHENQVFTTGRLIIAPTEKIGSFNVGDVAHNVPNAKCLQRVDVGIDPYRQDLKFVRRGDLRSPENDLPQGV